MNYAIYPMKNMRITQTYNGSTSHKPHTNGNYKDYPIDEGGKDTSREGVYCPCDEIVIKRLYGEGNKGTNTIFFESTTECDFADGTKGFLCGLITHANDSDLKNLSEGKIIKRKELICNEGTDGGVGMHTHLSFGKGKLLGSGWQENSNGKWVLYASGGTFKPEKLLFIDTSFTKIINKNGLAFKNLPKTTTSTTSAFAKFTGYVTASALNVRSGAGITKSKVGLLYKGNSVTVVGQSGTWYKINYKNSTAYVSKVYITKTKPVTYFARYTGKSTSLVDALKSLKIDSSLEYRKKIASANKISGYSGSATHNNKMLNLLKQGKLIKP